MQSINLFSHCTSKLVPLMIYMLDCKHDSYHTRNFPNAIHSNILSFHILQYSPLTFQKDSTCRNIIRLLIQPTFGKKKKIHCVCVSVSSNSTPVTSAKNDRIKILLYHRQQAYKHCDSPTAYILLLDIFFFTVYWKSLFSPWNHYGNINKYRKALILLFRSKDKLVLFFQQTVIILIGTTTGRMRKKYSLNFLLPYPSQCNCRSCAFTPVPESLVLLWVVRHKSSYTEAKFLLPQYILKIGSPIY